MPLSKGLQKLNSSSSDPGEVFYNATVCLKFTVEAHSTDIFFIIGMLDKGIRYLFIFN